MLFIHFTAALLICGSASSLPTPSHDNKAKRPYLPPYLITLEEHTVSPSLEAGLLNSSIVVSTPQTIPLLLDRPPVRLAAMDAAHISLTVLSQSPGTGVNNASACHAANIAMVSLVAAKPDRYAGFAILPMSNPVAAAAELRFATQELKLVGAMIWNQLPNGTYYDGEAYAPFWSAAKELGTPIYIHPVAASADVTKTLFTGTYAPSTAGRLGTNSFGWHVDVGNHVLRLYASGAFKRWPKLKIVIGNNGEGLAMFIDRVDNTNLGAEKSRDQTFDNVWRTNIWTTTSAFFTVRQFQMLRQVMPLERIMFFVDYPFSTFAQGWSL